jgi:hypothetical protein
MMSAFAANRDHVTVADVEAAVKELQWSEFTSNTNRVPALPTASAEPSAEPAAARASGTSSPQTVGRILLAQKGETAIERELKPGRLVIGRTPDNDLQIDSKFISRHHCQIVTQPDSCVIEDLNSTNGIYVMSKRVRRHNLNDGDVVHVGQHEIMYIDERVPRHRPSDMTDTEVLDKDKVE